MFYINHISSKVGQLIAYINFIVHSVPGGSESKQFACNAEDLSSIPESGRSPGGGNGNPLLYSCLEIPWTEEPGGLQSIGSQRVEHD